MKIESTKSLTIKTVNMLVYGNAGTGKTYLCRTLPKPLIISAEAGLLSLSDVDLPCVQISAIQDLKDVFKFLKTSKEAANYESIALDSISEIAEVVLATEKKSNKNPDVRSSYMLMQEQMSEIIRSFRDLPYHVYMSCKLEKSQDGESGRLMFQPSMPGNKLASQLPYFFDQISALRVERNAEGSLVRQLLCQPDGLWTAKDRSGKLSIFEPAHLGDLINKCIGGVK